MDFLFHSIQSAVFTIKKHIVCLTLFLIMFVVGIMCGVIIKQPQAIEEYYRSFCEKYVENVLFGGVGGILLDGLISFAFYTLISLPTVCLIFFVPIQGIFLFYKGFVFGIFVKLTFSLFGLSGGLVFFVVLLPQTLIFIVGFIGLSVCSFDCGSGKNGGISDRFRGFFPYFITFLCHCVLATLIDVLLIQVVFRTVFRIV